MSIKDFFGSIFGSDNEAENEEELIVEPYDFFIEADERYSCKKTFRTEDIRGADPLEILDEMELSPEVITNAGIRHKLKKLFDETAFEVGEYVSYEGGRTLTLSDTEELDGRLIELIVTVSRASDNDPFEAELELREASDDEDDDDEEEEQEE